VRNEGGPDEPVGGLATGVSQGSGSTWDDRAHAGYVPSGSGGVSAIPARVRDRGGVRRDGGGVAGVPDRSVRTRWGPWPPADVGDPGAPSGDGSVVLWLLVSARSDSDGSDAVIGDAEGETASSGGDSDGGGSGSVLERDRGAHGPGDPGSSDVRDAVLDSDASERVGGAVSGGRRRERGLCEDRSGQGPEESGCSSGTAGGPMDPAVPGGGPSVGFHGPSVVSDAPGPSSVAGGHCAEGCALGPASEAREESDAACSEAQLRDPYAPTEGESETSSGSPGA